MAGLSYGFTMLRKDSSLATTAVTPSSPQTSQITRLIDQVSTIIVGKETQITDCIAPGATPGTVACERQTEGAQDPALYGGATNTDNSGTMSYVQIRYSGFVLADGIENQPVGYGNN